MEEGRTIEDNGGKDRGSGARWNGWFFADSPGNYTEKHFHTRVKHSCI